MFQCPLFLQVLVIHMKVIRLMPERPEVAGVKTHLSKASLGMNPDLLIKWLFMQRWMFSVKPINKCRIISIKNKKAHTFKS